MSEVPQKIIQKPGWQTDLNHPFKMKVKEVIASSEKSTTIVMEYVKRWKSDIEGYDDKNILAERMAKFQNWGEAGHLGNNR